MSQGDSSSSKSSDGDASSEAAASLASIAENLQRSAIESARAVQHNSSTHFRAFQNFLPEAVSQYRTYEDAFFNKVKDGLMIAREHQALGVGLAISAALLAMRAPRRFLFRHTLGRFQSEEARYASAEKNVKDLNLSVDILKKESVKLLQRTALAEKEMKYGHTELVSAGIQYQQLAKSAYKVENQAADLLDKLRYIPSREALTLRAEVASVASILKRQRSALDKRIMKINELGVAV
ncbi:RGS1-HXK1-interacting protein 1 isoform X2 [Abrus precatorius]|uniref:RGS1-HXK1-interacting protein 1 isoform X2 n=1 Tax=Abrus precatorius TaxID=3816 RepID=A0A8B8KX98_ABRPR|nr:RGS1-HXK1-interacting protein 1 isoform X2 [Abrus precatorius]